MSSSSSDVVSEGLTEQVKIQTPEPEEVKVLGKRAKMSPTRKVS